MTQTQTRPLTRKELTELLKRTAHSSAAGMPIGPDCAQRLDSLFERAADVVEQADMLDDPAKLLEAAASASTLVNRMLEEARRQGLTELREVTFFAALQSLCPIWPFC